jgi:hypothetical protein
MPDSTPTLALVIPSDPIQMCRKLYVGGFQDLNAAVGCDETSNLSIAEVEGVSGLNLWHDDLALTGVRPAVRVNQRAMALANYPAPLAGDMVLYRADPKTGDAVAVPDDLVDKLTFNVLFNDRLINDGIALFNKWHRGQKMMGGATS